MDKHRYREAWALIGHETAAMEELENAMFSEASDEVLMDLQERIQYYRNRKKNVEEVVM